VFWWKVTLLTQARQKHQFVQDATNEPHSKMASLSAAFKIQNLYEMCTVTKIHEMVGTSEYGDKIVAHWVQLFSLSLSETAEFCERRRSLIHITR